METASSSASLARTLTAVQRRVVGVLVEKAKTTPEQYPLSVNALTAGSNQKSNRFPQMNLDTEDVEIALDELRGLGAVVEVQSGGRVPKYKHTMYEWLGVDKTELAVVAELLLRGAQTVGELRGRASRMEPISDLTALQPLLSALREKQLLLELTPSGRGQVVTHALYEEDELRDLTAQYLEQSASPAEARSASSPPSAGGQCGRSPAGPGRVDRTGGPTRSAAQ